MKTKTVSKTYVINTKHVSAIESDDRLINILYSLPWTTCTSSLCFIIPATRSSGTYRVKHKDCVLCTTHRNIKGKDKALNAWSGTEGSRKLRFPDFMTTAQDGGMVVSLRHRPPLPPGNTPGTHFC